tara:strand:- start:247 stop:486 length:240 start_codon:yes stop_codon:yes gene_type:complete
MVGVAVMIDANKLVFGFSSDSLGEIEWRWINSVKEKVFYQTWKPKQTDIKILKPSLTPTELKQLRLEIIVDLQSELKRI